MKKIIPFIIIIALIASCKSYNTDDSRTNDTEDAMIDNDTVSIRSDEGDYEIIIIDPGFNAWLYGTARVRGFYSQGFMETRNALFVQEWNIRNSQPLTFDPNLYELPIDYDRYTDYGYELNYKLYNYFIYFQLKNNVRLSSFIPRI